MCAWGLGQGTPCPGASSHSVWPQSCDIPLSAPLGIPPGFPPGTYLSGEFGSQDWTDPILPNLLPLGIWPPPGDRLSLLLCWGQPPEPCPAGDFLILGSVLRTPLAHRWSLHPQLSVIKIVCPHPPFSFVLSLLRFMTGKKNDNWQAPLKP